MKNTTSVPSELSEKRQEMTSEKINDMSIFLNEQFGVTKPYKEFQKKQWLSRDFHEEQMALQDAKSRKATLEHVMECIDELEQKVDCNIDEDNFDVGVGMKLLLDKLKQKLGGSQ